LRIQYWNSDEEFPASLQLMWDKNVLQYMRYETTWFAAMHVLNRVKEEMQNFLKLEGALA